MTSRERVRKALNHEVPDRVPLDLGSTSVTGIAASTLSRLRKALGLADRPVKVHEPYQILGRVEEDMLDALEIDVVGIELRTRFFGYPNHPWKPWRTGDGTHVLIGNSKTIKTKTVSWCVSLTCDVAKRWILRSPFSPSQVIF